ncbi:MAG: GIY-YIG nuclease family protein [Porticoccus sp.]
MELDEFLDFVSANDELGLLKVKAKTSAPTADEHLLAKFNEINEFVTVNGREPEALSMGAGANVPEFMLNQRLNAIRGNAEQCAALNEFDVHDLLPVISVVEVAEPEAEYQVDVEPEPKEIHSLGDIFSDDALGLLDDAEDSIFKIRNIPEERADADFVSRRKQCKDFDQYEDQLKAVQQDLSKGNRKLYNFSDNHLRAGGYFVLEGVLLLLKSIDAAVKEEKFNSGSRTRQDGRTHIIFENGTESNMLYRSLYKQLLKNGKSVSETNDESLAMFEKNMAGITDDDETTGYIYILQSLSSNPDISSIQNLYKIGYATTSVEKRIANAEKEPTYLMSAVHHVSSYKCFNMNAQKFENLLHTFFGKACLDIEVADTGGKICKPREWFIAPLKDIELAIQLLINGEIIHYRYDPISEQIVEKS